MKTITIIFVSLLVASGAHAAGCAPGLEKIGACAYQKLVEADEANPGSHTFTPKQIRSAYIESELEADEKFKNKLLILNGRATKIRKDFMDSVIVEFAVARPFDAHTVMAKLADKQIDGKSASEALRGVRAGQNVVLMCKGDGYLIESAQFSRCLFIPTEGK